MAAQGGNEGRADIAARRPMERRGTPRRRLGCLVALWRAREGISAVEFALATPILLGLILPLLDLGQAFSEQIRVNMAVQAGAQYASLNTWGSSSATDITNIVKGATSVPFTGASDSVSVAQKCGCPNTSGGPTLYTIPSAPATCSSQYPSCTADSQPAGYYVQVIASVTYTPLVPYSVLTGSGSTATLSSTAVVRIY